LWVSLVLGISMEILYNLRWLVFVELVVWIQNWNKHVTDGMGMEQNSHVSLWCVVLEHVYCRVRPYGCASTVACHSVWCFCIVPGYNTNFNMTIRNLTKNEAVWEQSVREIWVFNPYQWPSANILTANKSWKQDTWLWEQLLHLVNSELVLTLCYLGRLLC
jgi:hypothetical protein